MITIVDYGVGNIAALLNMFDHLGVEAHASADPREILSARKLLLPGVGAFDKAMRELRSRGLVGALDEAVLDKRTPVLGVCLGMQLLALNSEEGNEPGLGWIPSNVRRISPPASSGLKVPHIGWSDVVPTGSSVLFPSTGARERFYFVHSFHLCCAEARYIAATIDYGGEMVCAVSHDNIHGMQFHPEKSHRFGMRALASYASLDERAQA